MEYKFRAWDGEKMWYNVQYAYDYGANGKCDYPAESFGEILDNPKVIVMQSPGLKDRNGTLIFAGDIVKVVNQYKHGDGRIILSGIYKVISFYGELSLFRIEGLWSLTDFPVEVAPAYGQISEVEVIGNIHENLDLLNQEPANDNRAED